MVVPSEARQGYFFYFIYDESYRVERSMVYVRYWLISFTSICKLYNSESYILTKYRATQIKKEGGE